MIFLPFERLIINTPLSTMEIMEKLAQIIEPKKVFRGFSRDHKPYQGTLADNAFEISRIIHYRNSFLPIIKGQIEPDLGGSRVTLTMRPHIFVIAFMVVWLGGVGSAMICVGSAFIGSLLQIGDFVTPQLPGLIIPPLMFIFGCIMFVGAFQFEAAKSKTFFRQLFSDEVN